VTNASCAAEDDGGHCHSGNRSRRAVIVPGRLRAATALSPSPAFRLSVRTCCLSGGVDLYRRRLF
jgi:hypothetical protein